MYVDGNADDNDDDDDEYYDYGNSDNDNKQYDNDGARPSEDAWPLLAVGSAVPGVVQAELAVLAVVTVAVVQAPVAEIPAASRHFESFTQKI